MKQKKIVLPFRMVTLRHYIIEALLNIIENKKQNIAFLIFLLLSFIGIIITDSLIYSVSLKAEEELKVHNDKVVSVKIHQVRIPEDIIKRFSIISDNISFSKHSFLYVGDTPFSGKPLSVIGIDKTGLEIKNIKYLNNYHDGNVAIVHESSPLSKKKQIFINGVPFKIIGVILKSKTEFLDSLGLTGSLSREQVFIPLKTMFRFKLDNRIDTFKFVLKNTVTNEKIDDIKKMLYDHDIGKYDIVTSLNAKETVDRVLSRFSLLTNSVYIILTLSAAVTCFMLSKRNFYSRSTEFSLKIIHGTEQKEIISVVVIESLMLLIVCLIFSFIYAYLIMYIITHVLDVSINIRITMITISLANILMIFILSNVIFGKLFFSMNPVNVIKGKME